MAIKNIFIFNIMIGLFFNHINGKDMSSLTFVIDDTRSMWDDIAEVQQGVNAIFQTVLDHKNESQIENFILLTFNDNGPGNEINCSNNPGVRLRANVTAKEVDVFRDALKAIHPNNGSPGCQECPMAGIEEGIKLSLPKSVIYVFTDATAKDYYRYEYVKKYAMEKQLQIVFALTGYCGMNETNPMHKVYYDVANATHGEVYNIRKRKGDVMELLKYVKMTLTGRRTTIVDSKFSPGFHNITFYADALMGEVILSFASSKPNKHSVNVKASDGSDVSIKTVFSTEKVTICSVNVTKPGVHTVGVDSKDETHAVFSAKSGVDFQHGFSAINLSSIVDMSATPAPGVKSHLSIKLTEGDITLKAVQIMDLAGNVKMELPLRMADNGTKLYNTEAFLPPDTKFTIAIIGYDEKSDTTVTRKAPTPVEPQKLLPDEKEDKAPLVNIKGGSKIIANYDEPLQLICEVEGYPKPEIIWKNVINGAVLTGTISPGKNDFSNFINILSIQKVTKSARYSCEAIHESKRDYKEVSVEMIRKRYLYITTKTENITAEYEKEAVLVCTTDAYPVAVITWYKNEEMLRISGDTEMISTSNSSIVTIKKVTMTESGKYTCKAENDDTKKFLDIYITITNLLAPTVIKKDEKKELLMVKAGSKTFISCDVKGVPPPHVAWSKDNKQITRSSKFQISDDNAISFVADLSDTGDYICNATNELGTDYKTVEVYVTVAPTVVKDDTKKELITVNTGSETVLGCAVNGVPPPHVVWFKNNKEITNSSKFRISDDYTMSFTAELSDAGDYICNATNDLGTDYKTVEVYVTVAPTIVKDDTKKELIAVEAGSGTSIDCAVNGVPPPHVTWLKDNVDITISSKYKISDNYTISFTAEVSDAGDYVCNATNEVGTDYKTVEVYVTVGPTVVKDDKKKKLTVKADSETSIDCAVSGVPPPHVAWFKDNKEITNSSKFRISDDYTISFTADVSDAGDYVCNATNEVGTDYKTVEVYVTVGPTVVKDDKKKKLTVKADSETSIDCVVSGVPPPHVAWFKDNKEITNSSKFRISDDYTISFTADVSDAGDYVCNATNEVGTDYKTVEVYVTVGPTVVKDDKKKKLTVKADSETSIDCVVSGVPPPHVAWFKDNKKITNSSKFRISDDYTISFTADVSDAGDYVCNATNEVGTDYKTVEVYVTVGPTVVKDDKKKKLTVKADSETSIDCAVSGVPPPHVAWFKDNKEITNNSKFRISDDYTVSFTADLSDAGNYICNATNDLGTDYKTVEVYVTVAPKIVKDDKKKELITVKSGSETSIDCKVNGVPAPLVAWFKDDKEITNSTKFQIFLNHTIRFITELSDDGYYICNATNELGTDYKPVEVYVTDIPMIVKSKTKELVKVNLGSKAYIDCVVKGIPHPRVTWLKDNKKISSPKFHIFDNDTISFTAELSDAGDYICNATSDLGTDYKTVELYVTVAPTIMKNNKKEKEVVTVNAGLETSIHCKVNGIPSPHVAWLKNDKEITNSSKFKIFDNHTIRFIADFSDAGDYICTATNELGTDNKTVEVYVKVKPTIKKDALKTLVAVKGSNVSIACDVTGVPSPSVIWLQKNEKIKNSSKFHIFDNHTLSFTADVKDSKDYNCIASNDLGSDKKTVKVTVLVPPTIQIPRTLNKTLFVDDIIWMLQCKASGVPKPEISWKYQSFDASVPSHNIEVKGNKQRLTLEDIKMTDEGNYTCTAKNSAGSRSINHFIYVFEKPDIDRPNKTTIFAERGSSVQIDCKIIKGKPKPSITWYFKLVEGFKDSPETFNEIAKWKGKETIVVENVTVKNSGIYQCRAENEVNGKKYPSYLEITLNVEYRPEIKNYTSIEKKLKVEVGTIVSIFCYVVGSPFPEITWLKDGHKLVLDGKPYKYEFHNFKFVAEISHRGKYTCSATNKFDTVSMTVAVNVIESPSIVKTNHTDFFIKLGSKLTLPCQVKGNPKPKIKWIYQSFNASVPSNTALKHEKDNSLQFNSIQVPHSGRYICLVLNPGNNINVTYKVEVFAPAAIVNTYKEKRFVVVEGDLALHINCNTTGYPKPEVTWKKDNNNLASGSTYLVGNETLTIAKIPINASGNYTCEAQNSHGKTDFITYEVVVEKSPARGPAVIPPTYVERGESAAIPCPLHHEETDLLRWYKDQVLIHTGELTIDKSALKDSGEYICRVSTVKNSYSKTIEVIVGYSPIFIQDDYERNITLSETNSTDLNCETDGIPHGNNAWYYNDKKLSATEPIYFFPMGVGKTGEYRCEVNNRFGNISRYFYVIQEYCVIETSKLISMNRFAPLTLDSHHTWLESVKSAENIALPRGRQVVWFCPSNFNIHRGNYIYATCDGGANFKIKDKIHDYSKIRCNEAVKHEIKRTGQVCYLPGSETIKVGYNMTNEVDTVVYEICFDNRSKVPIYSKHILQKSFAGTEFDVSWSDSETFGINLDEAYDCDIQKETIQEVTGLTFHNDDYCCFGARQLVNPKDVFPGVPQRSTYSYFNVVPQWGTCNNENWDEVERRVRNFVKTSKRDLVVWTGTKNITKRNGIPIAISKDPYILVPLYLWKVVQDISTKSSLAIIQVNLPDLADSTEARRYVLCEDLCEHIGWMSNVDWHEVTLGYTYCCSIEEFKKNFDFRGIFEPSMESILKTND